MMDDVGPREVSDGDFSTEDADAQRLKKSQTIVG